MSAPSRGLMGNCLFRNIVLEFACLRATDLIFTRYIRVWGPPFSSFFFVSKRSIVLVLLSSLATLWFCKVPDR